MRETSSIPCIHRILYHFACAAQNLSFFGAFFSINTFDTIYRERYLGRNTLGKIGEEEVEVEGCYGLGLGWVAWRVSNKWLHGWM